MLLPTPANRFQSAADALTALTVKKSPPAVSNQSNLPKNLPAPSTPAPGIPAPSISKPNTPGLVKRNQPSFSLTEVLGSAAFVGFEGSLLYIGLTSLLSLSGVSLGILGMVMGGIVFALSRRIIEKADLIIFAGITAGIVAFVPALHSSLVVPSIFMIAAISGAGAIAITAFFRLVYQLLSRFL